MRLADAGNDIWYGDHEACDEHVAEFALAIHVYSPANQYEGSWCRCVSQGGPGLLVEYIEGHLPSGASVPPQQVAEYASQPGRLLIHCAGGVCRSPAYALLAKVARGCEFRAALHDVNTALWQACGCVPEWYAPVLDEIKSLARIYAVAATLL